MAEGKWIAGLSAGAPLGEAARRVVLVRLRAVAEHLPRVLEASEKNPEHVHQLRVSTRRADAALRIFRPCFGRRVYRRGRDRLRLLRRAAGDARDWDVFAADLAGRLEKADADSRPGLDFLLGYTRGRRDAAQPGLIQTVEDQCPAFKDLISTMVDAVTAPDELGARAALIDLARPTLTDLCQRLDRAAAEDLTSYDSLHQVRIRGKRLRYAMEVFAPCFDSSFRDKLYPRIEDMQTILGQANDSHVASERLLALRARLQEEWPTAWAHLGPGIDSLLQLHQRRLPQQRQRFLDWWESWARKERDSLLAFVAASPTRL